MEFSKTFNLFFETTYLHVFWTDIGGSDPTRLLILTLMIDTQMCTIACARSRFGVDTGRAREEKLERIEQKGDIMIIIMTISA